MIEHRVFIVVLFVLSLRQSVQPIKLSKLFFALEARQKAGAANERMKRLNKMKCSEAEWNGVIERMSEGVAAACALLSGCLAKKKMFSTNNLFARLPEADRQIHFYRTFIFLLQKKLWPYFLSQ